METLSLTKKEKNYFSSLAKQIKKNWNYSNSHWNLKFKISLENNDVFSLLLDNVISWEDESIVKLKQLIDNTVKIKEFEHKFKLERKNKLKLKENSISAILKEQEMSNKKNEISNIWNLFEYLNQNPIKNNFSFIEKNNSNTVSDCNNEINPEIGNNHEIVNSYDPIESGTFSPIQSETVNTEFISKKTVLRDTEETTPNPVSILKEAPNKEIIVDSNSFSNSVNKEMIQNEVIDSNQEYDFDNIIKEPVIYNNNDSFIPLNYNLGDFDLDSITEIQQSSESTFSKNSWIRPVNIEEDCFTDEDSISRITDSDINIQNTWKGVLNKPSKGIPTLEEYEITDQQRSKTLKDSHKKIIRNAVPNVVRKTMMTGTIEDYANNVNYEGYNLNGVWPSEYLPSIEDNQFAVESSMINNELNLWRKGDFDNDYGNLNYQNNGKERISSWNANNYQNYNSNSSNKNFEIDEYEMTQFESVLNSELFKEEKEDESGYLENLDQLYKKENTLKIWEIEVKAKDNSFVNIDDLNLDFVPEVQTTSLDLDSDFFKEVRNLSSKKWDSEILKLKIRPFYIFLTLIVIGLLIYVSTLISFGELFNSIKFALGL